MEIPLTLNSLPIPFLLLQIYLQLLALNPDVNPALERLSRQHESFATLLWICGVIADPSGEVHVHLYLARHPNHRFQPEHSSVNLL